MVIEKVHGLHATGMSLSDRFKMQSSTAPVSVAARRNRRQNSGFLNHNSIASLLSQTNIRNQDLINQIARKLELQTKRKALHERLGVPQGGLRRYGSQTSLPGLRRANSFSNLSQSNFENRGQWRGSNGNLSRSASFGNLNQLNGQRWQQRWGFKRRGTGNRGLRGRFRGVMEGRVTRSQIALRSRGGQRGGRRGQRGARGALREQAGARGGPRGGQAGARGGPRGGQAGARGGQRGARGQRGRGARGRGRGGNRQQQIPSKEELDLQLDEYMASSKSALDKELDNYMKTAMEMEM